MGNVCVIIWSAGCGFSMWQSSVVGVPCMCVLSCTHWETMRRGCHPYPMDQLKGHALPRVHSLGACSTSSRREALVGVDVIWLGLKRSSLFWKHPACMLYGVHASGCDSQEEGRLAESNSLSATLNVKHRVCW
jgi:hypothetical protein